MIIAVDGPILSGLEKLTSAFHPNRTLASRLSDEMKTTSVTLIGERYWERGAKTRYCPIKSKESGGEGGIRTHGTVSGTPHFECGTFDHSATSPRGNGTGWKADPSLGRRGL